MQTFEDLTGLSRSTVVRSITELSKVGLLYVQRLQVDKVNEVNCYEILLPVENAKVGGSKMKPPYTADTQPETSSGYTIQELSTGGEGGSKMKPGVVSKLNLYKERDLKKEYKKSTDMLALVEEAYSPHAKPDTTCPKCGMRATLFEVNRYGTCSYCFVKSV